MGKLYYGSATDPIEMPERTLAHLKVLISTKLRRSESFSLSWDQRVDGELVRSSIWLHCSIPLRFQVDAEQATQLDRAYLNELAMQANSTAGIVIDLSEEIDEGEQSNSGRERRVPTLVRAA